MKIDHEKSLQLAPESTNWMLKYISLPVRNWDVRFPVTVSVPLRILLF